MGGDGSGEDMWCRDVGQCTVEEGKCIFTVRKKSVRARDYRTFRCGEVCLFAVELVGELFVSSDTREIVNLLKTL